MKTLSHPISISKLPNFNRIIRQVLFLLLFHGILAAAARGQTIQWDKTFGGYGLDELTSLQQTADGGYILGGTSFSGSYGDKTEANKGGTDYWVIKLNAVGQKQWDKTIGGNGFEGFQDLQQTADGGYILGGSSNSSISGDKTENSRGGGDYWVVKLNADGSKAWDKTFGGRINDQFLSLQQTSDGGYILGGWSYSGISGDKSEASKGELDFWIVKLNVDGSKAWDKTIGGRGNDQFLSLQQTSDGGYILGGSSDSGIGGDKTQASKGSTDYWVVKLNPNGSKAWDKTIGGSDSDALRALQQTADGGYILGGSSYSGISGDKTEANKGGPETTGTDYWIVKLNTNGTKAWDKTIGGSDSDELDALQQTADGGYILGGSSNSPISGDKTEVNKGGLDYWVIKLNADGTKAWDKTIGGSDEDQLTSLQQTTDGEYILGGSSRSGISGDKTQASKGDNDYWVVKLNNENNTCNQTVSSFTLVNADTHRAIRPLQEGDVIALGALPTQNLKISAQTNPATVGSVVFHLDGQQVAIENIKPYRYGGPGKLTVGAHTLTATPYCGPRGQGFPGKPLTLHFQVIQSSAFVQITPDKDNTLRSTSPEVNEGSSTALFTGMTGESGGPRIHRALLHFDLSSIPAGSIIESASLELFFIKVAPRPAGISLHQLKVNWGELESTWSHAFLPGTPWTTPGGDYAPTATATTGDVLEGPLVIANLAADVQAWVNNAAENYGWLLKGTEEVQNTAKILGSRESSEPSRPVLSISYTPPSNKAPQVRLTIPDQSVDYSAPARVKLRAYATAADNPIRHVRFYQGATLLHTEYIAPYGFIWRDVPAGAYTLTAVATDKKGLSTTSAPITLTVTASLLSGAGRRQAVENNRAGERELILAPNPVRSTLQIFTTPGQEEREATVFIFAASGQLVRTLHPSGTDPVLQLDVSSLAPGVYTVKLFSGIKSWSKRFIKW